jgi:hypothetical protein
MKRLPARFEPQLFALLLSGLMSLVVTSVAVIGHIGWIDGVLGMCVQTWLPAWGIAFPLAMILVPVIKKLVRRCVEWEG